MVNTAGSLVPILVQHIAMFAVKRYTVSVGMDSLVKVSALTLNLITELNYIMKILYNG